MRFLVTRAQEDAESFAADLRERNHDALIAPLLSVQFIEGLPLELNDVAGVLVTSANGVRALARRTSRRDFPVFAVGPRTAEVARSHNFARVESANGDAGALAKALPHWIKADEGALLHATDLRGASRLGSLLAAQGYEVRPLVLYKTIGATKLPDNAARALQDGSLDGAFFFSPRSAMIFKTCILRNALAETCSRLGAYCISQAAADALTPLTFAQICIAKQPNRHAILATLPLFGAI